MLGVFGTPSDPPPQPGVDFGYEGQPLLFKNLDFGIDMESRGEGGGYVNGGGCGVIRGDMG